MEAKYSEQSIKDRIISMVEGNLYDISVNLGKAYLEYRKTSSQLPDRQYILELFTPTGVEHLIKFFRDNYKLSLKITGSFACDGAFIVFTYYSKPIFDKKKDSFFLQDTASVFDKYIVINSIVSPCGNGNGQKALKSFLEKYYTIPVVLQAGFLLSGDYEYYRDTGSFDYVNKLVQIYERLGFINVNDKIGQYEESYIMINPNGCKEEDSKRFNSIISDVQNMDVF